MKKVISMVVLAVMLVSFCFVQANAAAWAAINFSPGDSTQTGNQVKTSATGSDADINISTLSGQWIYRIRLASDGTWASKQLRFPYTTGPTPHPYERDGYGNSLGRNNYSYRLNVAYYSLASGNGSTTGNFTP